MDGMIRSHSSWQMFSIIHKENIWSRYARCYYPWDTGNTLHSWWFTVSRWWLSIYLIAKTRVIFLPSMFCFTRHLYLYSIKRSNLANVILTLKSMGIKDVIGFEFLDPPDPILLVQVCIGSKMDRGIGTLYLYLYLYP